MAGDRRMRMRSRLANKGDTVRAELMGAVVTLIRKKKELGITGFCLMID